MEYRQNLCKIYVKKRMCAGLRKADREIGICRAVWAVVCGWMRYAALPPALVRGVSLR